METDGVTRVFVTGGGEPKVRQVWPVREETEITGEMAKIVLERAEFRCVSVIYSNRGTHKTTRILWDVYPKNWKTAQELFEVNRKGWTGDQHYSKLAEALERRTGKKGLTIVVS